MCFGEIGSIRILRCLASQLRLMVSRTQLLELRPHAFGLNTRMSQRFSSPLRRIDVLGRLAPGFTAEGAREELDAIYERVLKSEGVQPEDMTVVASLREFWTNFSARPLYFFMGAVALVLLIACVNTAGLLLARG